MPDEPERLDSARDTLCPPLAQADAEGRPCPWTCPDCGCDMPAFPPGAAPGCARPSTGSLAAAVREILEP